MPLINCTNNVFLKHLHSAVTALVCGINVMSEFPPINSERVSTFVQHNALCFSCLTKKGSSLSRLLLQPHFEKPQFFITLSLCSINKQFLSYLWTCVVAWSVRRTTNHLKINQNTPYTEWSQPTTSSSSVDVGWPNIGETNQEQEQQQPLVTKESTGIECRIRWGNL